MQKKICFIENSLDIDLILKNLNVKGTIFVPLNLETFLFCKKKRLEIFDFKENIGNKFHQTALETSKKFTDNLQFIDNINYSLKSEIIFLLRFRLNSLLFLIEIVEKCKKQYKIDTLIVSGVTTKFHNNFYEANIVSEIIEYVYGSEFTIQKLTNNNIFEKESILTKYHSFQKIKFKKKNILLSNAGYNFSRIIKIIKKYNVNFWVPFYKQLSYLKKIVFFLKGFQPIEFIKDYQNVEKEKVFIEKINFSYGKIDLSKLLNNFYNKLNFYFNDTEQKSIAIKKFINDNNFSLTISNITKGLDGCILDREVSCNSLCIPHGIIAKSFNKHDEIYKKIISEAVFNGESKYFAIQSKIAKNSLDTHKINGKIIETGNLIFASIKKNFDNKKYLLHASTIKDFYNLQFLGVEMFYEYWNNLSILNKIAKDNPIKIIIKPHPTIKNCTDQLKENFKNLRFSNNSIDLLLKKSSLVISYSSSVIEDALNSFTPVILFDKENRYMHLSSNKDLNTLSAVNYISSEISLVNIIKNLNSRKKEEDFGQHIFFSDFNKNIRKNILSLL